MVIGVFQFTPVNLTTRVKSTVSGLTVPSVASLELSPMVTSPVGWLPRTIVKVAVPPASVVGPEIDDSSIVYLLAKPVPRPTIILTKLIVAVGVTAALVLSGCSSDSGGEAEEEPSMSSEVLIPVKLQLQWFTQAQFAGYYAAIDQGYYVDEGLDVQIVEGGTDIVPQSVLADGSVRFLKDSTNLQTMWSLGSRSGGEIVSADSL